MLNKTPQTKPQRLSQSWRKHIRRLKQAARKAGTTYATSRPVVSIPKPLVPVKA